MKITTKKIIGGIAIGAALIAVLSVGLSLIFLHSGKAMPTNAGIIPEKSSVVSPAPQPALPTPTNTLSPNLPTPTPQSSQNTPGTSPTASGPGISDNVSVNARLIANGSSLVPVTPEEAIKIFQRMNSTQTISQNSTGVTKSNLILKSVRADRYCVFYNVTFSAGTAALETTFVLLRDSSGLYNADIVNKKATAQLQSMTASAASSALIKPLLEVINKVNLDTTAIGMLQSIYTGPILSTNSGSGLLVSYTIDDDQTVYTVTVLSDSVGTATTSITLPRTVKGCDLADKNNNISLGRLDSSIAFYQNQTTEPTAASRLSLQDQASLRDMVKRALYITLLKRWYGPICDDVILSQDPSRVPATGIFINSLEVKGNTFVGEITSALNVLNPDLEGSNTVYTASGSITDALNQTGAKKPDNTAVESNLSSEIRRENGYRSIAAGNLHRIAVAADEHIIDLRDQQVQVPFPLRHTTGQVYKGPMLLCDPKTRVDPQDGLKVQGILSSTADIEAMSVRYCRNGAVEDTIFWLAKTAAGVDEANAHEIQAQADLKIYSIQSANTALTDLINLHNAIISQNNTIKKSGKNLIPVPESSDEILKRKTQRVFYEIDPLMPVLSKLEPIPNGANGIIASKDFQVSSDGSCINCYIQFLYRDTITKRDPVELSFQLPITEYGRVKTALPAIQALIKNPPANLPAEAGITSLTEFLTKIQSYANSRLVPANIINN